jgi:hypothetical protein
MNSRVILDLCGGSGAWSKPYKEAGYIVSLITLPDEDVRLFEYPAIRIHGILAAPPCTMFASSGARWKRTDEQMIEALSVVDACLRLVFLSHPVWWVLENPVGKLTHYLGPSVMYFDPCDFGDNEPYTKRTCLWGKFNPPIENAFRKIEGKNPIHYMPPSDKRGELRSITPSGFAQAFFEVNP